MGDHILVYGAAGSGKTVSVSQAVRQFVGLGDNHLRYIVHWVNIGIITYIICKYSKLFDESV